MKILNPQGGNNEKNGAKFELPDRDFEKTSDWRLKRTRRQRRKKGFPFSDVNTRAFDPSLSFLEHNQRPFSLKIFTKKAIRLFIYCEESSSSQVLGRGSKVTRVSLLVPFSALCIHVQTFVPSGLSDEARFFIFKLLRKGPMLLLLKISLSI